MHMLVTVFQILYVTFVICLISEELLGMAIWESHTSEMEMGHCVPNTEPS